MDSASRSSSLLLATTNQGKVRELRALLGDLPITLTSIDQLPTEWQIDVEETGSTFIQNAQLKAQSFGQRTGLPTVADDSGLEVVALHGEPGVRSARWVAGSDEQRVTALLQKLTHVTDRRARFVCALYYFDPETNLGSTFIGTVDGQLATQPLGNDGFGYDPIFIPDGYNQTFAQLGASVKNAQSHRARAMRQFVSFLKQRGLT